MGIKEWPIIRYAVCVDCGKSFPVRREIGDMERCEPHRKSEAKRRHFEKHPEAYARKLERERVRALNRTPEQVAQKKEREALARNSPDGRKKSAKRTRDYVKRRIKADPDFYAKEYAKNRERSILNTQFWRHKDRVPKWADRAAIDAIYLEAIRKTEESGVMYHVDHIVPLKGKTVSGLHVAENLRIVSAYENSRKSNKLEEISLCKL